MDDKMRKKGIATRAASALIALLFCLSAVSVVAVADEYKNPYHGYTDYYTAEDQAGEDPDVLTGADVSWWTSDPDAESYTISTAAELYGLMYLVDRQSNAFRPVDFEGKTIYLDADIDLDTVIPWREDGKTFAQAWVGIGWGDYVPSYISYNHFWGAFEGNGHTISGTWGYPLFGKINNARIANLTTSGTMPSGTGSATVHDMAGIAITAVDSTIYNCHSDIDFVYEYAAIVVWTGGILLQGIGDTTVDSCTFSGSYTSTSGRQGTVGGIVGVAAASSQDDSVKAVNLVVKNCVNTADLPGGYNVGGIVGGTITVATGGPIYRYVNIEIVNCTNTGNISALTYNGQYTGAGGILGMSGLNAPSLDMPFAVTISDCVNYGDVSGYRTNAGGIVGYVQQGYLLSIEDSENYGDVTVSSDNTKYLVTAGGIVGRVDNGGEGNENVTIVDVANEGEVSLGALAEGTPASFGDIIGSDPDFVAAATETGELASYEYALAVSSESATAAGFDLAANIADAEVNVIEAVFAYDGALFDASVDGHGAAVEAVAYGDGTVSVLLGVLNEDALDGIIATVTLALKEGADADEATLELLSLSAYSKGEDVTGLLTAIETVATASLAEPPEPPEEGDPLDANGDGAVDAKDLSLVLYYYGYAAEELGENVGADVNGDGVVTMADVTLVVEALGYA